MKDFKRGDKVRIVGSGLTIDGYIESYEFLHYDSNNPHFLMVLHNYVKLNFKKIRQSKEHESLYITDRGYTITKYQ